MDISYLGHSSFKIKFKTASVITDPFDSKVEAEIVTVSHNHPDHNVSDKISSVKKVVDGPGEYEISGVSIMGYKTSQDENTVYVIEADGLRIVHLGDLGHLLSDELVDEIGDVDVLMIPVGGFSTVGPKEATEIISKIEPYFVIPMHYGEKLLPVTDFLKESGLTTENLPKFSLKKEDILEDQNTKAIVLERR